MSSRISAAPYPVVVPSTIIHKHDNKTYFDSVLLQFGQGDLQVFVGDTVVIPCNNAKKEPTATWYPWKKGEPWSVIQVLSLYKTKDSKYRMEFRWFWRYYELQHHEQTLWGHTPPDASLRVKCVVESNCTGNTFVREIMGLAVLTSQVSDFLQFYNSTTTSNHNPVPTVGLLCRGYIDFSLASTSFKSTNQWNGRYGSHACFEIMLERGFICLAKEKRKCLMDQYTEHFEMRPRLNFSSCSSKKQYLDGSCLDLPRKKMKENTTASVVSLNSELSSRSNDKENQGRTPGSRVSTAKSSLRKVKKKQLSRKMKRTPTSPKECDGDGDFFSRSKQEADCRAENHVGSPSVQQSDNLKCGTNFYRATKVPVYLKKCVSRLVSKTQNQTWTVSIGDVVCVEHNFTGMNKSFSTVCKEWHPFKISWTCCQVLSIYKEGEEILLEVRWFPRVATIKKEILLDLNSNFSDDEVLETAIVDCGIPASTILGRVDLLLGHHCDTCDAKTDQSTIPTVRLRCRYFFFEGFHRIQPLYCRDTSPQIWRRRLIERGANTSPLIQQNGLKSIVEFCLGTCEKTSNFFSDLLPTRESNITDVEASVLWSDGSKDLVHSSAITPLWHLFIDADHIWHMDDRKEQNWIVHIGDVVAAIKGDSTFPMVFDGSRHRWFPFNVNWCPCQIVSITRTEGKLLFEVQWLLGANDTSGKVRLPKGSRYDLVFESTSSSLSVVSAGELLAPVCVTSTLPVSIPSHLPHCILAYGGLWSSENQILVSDAFSFASMTERSIQFSTTYDESLGKASVMSLVLNLHSLNDCDTCSPQELKIGVSRSILPELDDLRSHMTIPCSSLVKKRGCINQAQLLLPPPSTTTTKNFESADNRISTTIGPFHVDKSTLRAHFTEIEIKPPFSHFVSTVQNHEREHTRWKVKVGDIVAVHYKHGAGKAFFDVNDEHTPANYPFTMPWAVAEIVMIWKAFEHMEDLPFSGNCDESQESPLSGDLEMEIRWFWRRIELPGFSKARASQRMMSSCCEEIFETDHIDRCSASSILAPVKVHYSTLDFSAPAIYELGMPVLQFRCSRLWSFHRKSILPFIDFSGRTSRSRMYSTCFSSDPALKQAIESFEKREQEYTTPLEGKLICCDDGHAKTWPESFQRVMGRLNLTQASIDAFQEGVALIGRDRECKEIVSFLRGAICSVNKSFSDGSKCPSIFIAGPPGTGKTVSVCSIIGNLRRDKIDGRIPNFDFFSLNGMEMRHPFEAYVKFWELLSGPARERLSPELAAAKLERYFSGIPVKSAPKRSVIVLVLDEIDYLVTKKETVLYNFFDWPKRSFETADSPRLVIIGISNTVDLPSKLKASVRSRLGGNRCDFKAYNSQDIFRILSDRINPDTSDHAVFDTDAILFAAKKVAAVSGDIRKAFKMCKAAAEAVMLEALNGTRNDPKASTGCPMVRIKDVQRVAREKMGSVVTYGLASLAPLEALVVVALACLSKCPGRSNGGIDIVEVLTKAESVANASGETMYLPPPSFPEILTILEGLADSRLVRLHTEKSSAFSFRSSNGGSGGAWPVISSAIDSSDILVALRQGPHRQLAEIHLGGFML